MEFPFMTLSSDQKSVVIERFKETTMGSCPLCQQQQWRIADDVYELRQFHHGRVVVGDQTAILPLLVLNCGHCGYTALFNAGHYGVDLEKGRD